MAAATRKVNYALTLPKRISTFPIDGLQLNAYKRSRMKTKHLRLRLYRDKKKHFRWALLAPNGRIIAEGGEGYQRRKAMDTSACTALLGTVPEFLLASLGDYRSDIELVDETLKGK